MIGKTLGKYQITTYLGSGGMAHVYKAYHADLDRHVAIKVMKAADADAPDYLQRFKIEARSIAALRHPHIVQIFDYDIDPDTGQPYMIMEFLQGGTLNDYLTQRQGQLLSLTEAVQIVGEIGSALAYAHEHGVLHRDVKPGNIMRDAIGRFVLTDFGLAKMAVGPTVTKTGAVAGTPAYMAPEQALGESVDARADLYALGGVFFQLLTGRLPYHADSAPALLLKIINAPVPDPRRFNAAVPPSLAQIVMRCLAKKPNERYAALADFLAALQQASAAAGLNVNVPIKSIASTDQLSAEHSAATVIIKPAAAVDVNAEQVEVGGDVVGRDKIVQNIYPSVDMRFSPFQVPREVPHFVGRKMELSTLIDQLTQPDQVPSVAICGLGGMGKTSLAIELAYQVRQHFTDGVLWADAATTTPAAVLYNWARAYGCDFSALPDVNIRAAAFREVLADRKVLMIIDDVRDAEHVRLLLPGGLHNAVLLTTRNRELAEALNAHVILLTELTAPEGREMLTRMLGKERVVQEEEAASEICRLLLNLPLALEITAGRLNSRPRWKLADMAGRLRDEQHRLRELKIGDREVRASFRVSWETLTDDLRQAFAQLAVFEGRAISAKALAAISQLDEYTAADQLNALLTLSLVAEEGAIHYRQHPLLADFAREHLPPADVAPLRQRMTEYYLNYAQQYESQPALLEPEWPNLSANERMVYQQKQWAMVVAYAETLAEARFTQGRLSAVRQSFKWASEAAAALNDQPALARCLLQWARACIEQGDYEEAKEHLKRSLALSQIIEDMDSVARAQLYLGHNAYDWGKLPEALKWLTEALVVWGRQPDRHEYATALYLLGMVELDYDRLDRAEQYGRQALSTQVATQDETGKMRTLTLLAEVAYRQYQDDTAQEYCQQALEIGQRLKNLPELADTSYTLCKILRDKGLLEDALETALKTLAISKMTGDRRLQAQVLLQTVRIHAALGDYEAAIQQGQLGLTLCREIDDRMGIVWLKSDLGEVHHLLKQDEMAAQIWAEALEFAENNNIDHPRLSWLRERLGHSSPAP